MEEIAPGPRFPYRPLEQDSIRLIRLLPTSTPTDIQCTLEHHHDYYSSGLRYTCLSYFWGDPNMTKTIVVDGYNFEVTTNLWHALSHLIQYFDASEIYWIDAVCLNQSNLQERNDQVHQMWRIYSNAVAVMAWLGLACQRTEQAFSTLLKVEASCTSFSDCDGCDSSGYALMTNPVMSNEYFERTWIIPELMNAKRVVLIRGRYQTDFKVLYHLRMFLPISGIVITRFSIEHDVNYYSIDHTTALRRIKHVLYNYCRSYCSDCRDRVFALLGDPVIRRLDPHHSFKPDYKMTPEEVAIEFFGYCDVITQYSPGAGTTGPGGRDEFDQIRDLLISALCLPCTADDFLQHTLDDKNCIFDEDGLREVHLKCGTVNVRFEYGLLHFAHQFETERNQS